MNQLIPEALLAVGAAFLVGNLAAYLRLRWTWRGRRAERAPAAERPPATGDGPSATGDGPPSQIRILVNIAIGLLVTLAALGALLRSA